MVVFLCASSALLGVFGADYAAHGKTLLILLTIAAVPDAITNVYVGIVRVERRLLIGAAITFVIAVIGIGVTVALLPTQGIAGAGWAWLIAQTSGCLVVGVDLVVKSRRGPALRASHVALS
jgi:Na+-driven multidrug efflux pump